MARFSDSEHPAQYAGARRATPRAQSTRDMSPYDAPAPQPGPRQRGRVPLVIGIVLGIALVAVLALVALRSCAKPSGETTNEPQVQAEPQGSEQGSAEATESVSDTPQPSGPDIDASAWELTLMNKTHAIPESWEVSPVEVRDGKLVDARIADALLQMVNDCYAAGYEDVYVNQGYRTHETQQAIWDETYANFLAQGYSEEEALAETGAIVAVPGCSEHELGLAADICSYNFDETYNAPIQSWLAENGWQYGFIQRYPAGKEAITGINNENWHFRYVGVDAAKEIHDNGWVLEEYLAAHGVEV